jgi:hypothetical protein
LENIIANGNKGGPVSQTKRENLKKYWSNEFTIALMSICAHGRRNGFIVRMNELELVPNSSNPLAIHRSSDLVS